MGDDREGTSAASGAKGYKRSWKNLLINKRYQLRFTLFMVGVSALLMIVLGWWVMRVANEATKVAESGVLGDACRELPDPSVLEAAAATPVEPEPTPVPQRPPEGGPASEDRKPPADPSPVPDGEAAPDQDGSGRSRVVLDEPTMIIAPEPVPADIPAYCGLASTVRPDKYCFAFDIAEHYECEMRQAAKLDALDAGRMLIMWVLIFAGLVVVVGMGVYGIKMTHKVAGPLYKVTLYMAKMRDGRLDRVYNLRKGDQLVNFYDHFKTAHTGVVDMEKADITRLRALLAAAEAGGVEGKSPEVDAAIAELRAMIARKEKSIA